MPELPEVATICHNLTTAILNKKIIAVTIRNFKLRHLIPKNLPKTLIGQKINEITRRGKYLLFKTKNGTLIIHLGMSGNLQIKPLDHLITKHDHCNIIFNNNSSLCYNDPRRFGIILWTTKNPVQHPLLKNLGREPLAKNFTADYLFNLSRKIRSPIKQFIMNNKIVVGIGNIYANETLFAAQIHPFQKVNTIPIKDYRKLVREIKKILKLAIKYGGTTIKDHTDLNGNQGLFQKKLKVYGRQNNACYKCQNPLTHLKLGQRSTIFCSHCQKKHS